MFKVFNEDFFISENFQHLFDGSVSQTFSVLDVSRQLSRPMLAHTACSGGYCIRRRTYSPMHQRRIRLTFSTQLFITYSKITLIRC